MKIILMNTVNCKQMTVGTWEFFYILLLSVTADELRVPRPHLQIVFAHAMYLWIYGSCKTNLWSGIRTYVSDTFLENLN